MDITSVKMTIPQLTFIPALSGSRAMYPTDHARSPQEFCVKLLQRRAHHCCHKSPLHVVFWVHQCLPCPPRKVDIIRLFPFSSYQHPIHSTSQKNLRSVHFSSFLLLIHQMLPSSGYHHLPPSYSYCPLTCLPFHGCFLF